MLGLGSTSSQTPQLPHQVALGSAGQSLHLRVLHLQSPLPAIPFPTKACLHSPWLRVSPLAAWQPQPERSLLGEGYVFPSIVSPAAYSSALGSCGGTQKSVGAYTIGWTLCVAREMLPVHPADLNLGSDSTLASYRILSSLVVFPPPPILTKLYLCQDAAILSSSLNPGKNSRGSLMYHCPSGLAP